MAGQVHAGGAAGAGVLHVVDRQAGLAEIAQQHLAEDHAAEHVAGVEGLYRTELDAGIAQGTQHGFLGQVLHRGVVAAEAGHRCAGDVDGLVHAADSGFSGWKA
ncbi:hypothetical protein D3C81_1332690 [compost metagenome]